MDNKTIDKVMEQLKSGRIIEIEASGRHVHLTREAVDFLYGKDYKLTKSADLSQPGQFICKERVSLMGLGKTINNVVVLGPERENIQVEISKTDCLSLGVKTNIRESGNTKKTPGIFIVANSKVLSAEEGLIIAKRHIHLTIEHAKKIGVSDQDIVQVKTFGERSLIFNDVVVRVSEKYASYMHIDYDEANACNYKKGDFGYILN